MNHFASSGKPEWVKSIGYNHSANNVASACEIMGLPSAPFGEARYSAGPLYLG